MFYLVMPQDYPTERKAALIETLLTELRRQPDVRQVGYTYAGPLLGIVDFVGVFVPPGRTPDEMRDVDPELRTLRNLNTREDYLAALAEAGLT